MGRYLEAEELLKDREKDEARFVKALWQDLDQRVTMMWRGKWTDRDYSFLFCIRLHQNSIILGYQCF